MERVVGDREDPLAAMVAGGVPAVTEEARVEGMEGVLAAEVATAAEGIAEVGRPAARAAAASLAAEVGDWV